MRIGIKFDSVDTPELRALLAEWSKTDGNVSVRCNGPELWAADTDMVSESPRGVAELLRAIADRIDPYTGPLIKDADPELERLLAEEAEIERETRDARRFG